MKGCRASLIWKYCQGMAYGSPLTNPNGASSAGWCLKIVSRFLKISRYTCFSSEEHEEKMSYIHRRLSDKFNIHGNSSFVDEVIDLFGSDFDDDGYIIWINGKRRSGLSKKQKTYIKRLWSISERMRKLKLKYNFIT